MHVSQTELQMLSKPCPHSQSWLSEGTLPNSFYETNINYSIVLIAQSYPALCNPMDCSPPASYVHGIPQARIREWVAIPFSRASS